MKVIRDPVHNLIYFDKKEDELLLKLIDTQEFCLMKMETAINYPANQIFLK